MLRRIWVTVIVEDKTWLKQTMVEAEVMVDMLVSQSAIRKGIKKFAAYLLPSDLRRDMCIPYQCIKCMEACRCTGICLFIGKTSREDDRMFSRQIRSRKAVSNICMGATKHAHAYRGLALTPEEITDYERWS